jgi:hypothetical protein
MHDRPLRRGGEREWVAKSRLQASTGLWGTSEFVYALEQVSLPNGDVPVRR